METTKSKQPVLKPQDLVVALKIAIKRDRKVTFSDLALELSMSASEVHAASQRAESSRLLTREFGQLHAVHSSIHEFVLHGVKYAFPGKLGPLSRGLATSASAPPLSKFFSQDETFPLVWPDTNGSARGMSLLPLYPSVTLAARIDEALYEVLVLVDAIRIGAAREREIAQEELLRRIP